MAILLVFTGVRIYKSVNFNIDCTGHLKRAADANSITMAKKELKIALDYLEKNNLTKGYTSVLYQTPDEDIEFWYMNLKSSLEGLNSLSDSSSKLEQTNVLMKLRETLLDQGDKGQSITCPDGISVYPDNKVYAWVGWVGLFLSLLSGCVLAVKEL